MSLVDPDTIQPGEPPWRIALLYPPQGHWTTADYLSLDAGRLVEFDQGCVEMLDWPTREHQLIVQYIYRALFAVVDMERLGEVFVAPLPICLWDQKYREPDVLWPVENVGLTRRFLGNEPIRICAKTPTSLLVGE